MMVTNSIDHLEEKTKKKTSTKIIMKRKEFRVSNSVPLVCSYDKVHENDSDVNLNESDSQNQRKELN